MSNNCTRETLSKTTSGGLYQVGLVEEDKQRCKVVEYSSICSIDVRCGCSMFETLGILCKHALCMLKKKKVLELSHSIYCLDGPCRSGIGWVIPDQVPHKWGQQVDPPNWTCGI